MAKMKVTYHDDVSELAVTNSALAAKVATRLESSSLPPEVIAFFGELLEVARAEWADDVWRLFDENKELRILSVGWWVINFTFRVKHCSSLIRLIAGPRPPMVG